MKSTPRQGNFDACWFCCLMSPHIPPIARSHVFIRRRIRNLAPSLVRAWTATRHPNIPVIAALSDTTERTANAVQINEARKKKWSHRYLVHCWHHLCLKIAGTRRFLQSKAKMEHREIGSPLQQEAPSRNTPSMNCVKMWLSIVQMDLGQRTASPWSQRDTTVRWKPLQR